MATQGRLSNQTLGNKYLLGDLLGYGGFGEVYRAQNILLNRPQAIKVILEKHLSDPKFRERFLREARLLAALNHPNIVHVDDFRLEEERAYLVMPFIEGGTLHSLLVKREPLSLPKVREYLEQISSALDYAHKQNVVHLDLKPRNLLHHNGILFLSDFGLAHLIKQGTLEGGTSLGFGSPFYMAPEQIHGKPEARSDIYALGVILYQMLTGHLPFEGSAPEAILFKHWTELPPPLRRLRPDLSLALELVINRALAKDPEQRYAIATELLQAFSAALHSVPPFGERKMYGSIEMSMMNTQPLQKDDAQQPDRISPDVLPPKHGLSRRRVIVGLGTLAGTGLAGGGITWLVRSRTSAAFQPESVNSSGTMFGYDLQRTHFFPNEHILSPANVSRLVPYWTASTGGFLTSLLASSPVVANGIVYVGSENHKLYAFDAATGKTLWAASTNDFIRSSPAVANNIVYVGSDDHKLYAFDATTGKTLWSASTGNAIYSSPIVVKNAVYVGSNDHKLHAFNATTGHALWSMFTNGSLGFSSPIVANNVVYIGSGDKRLYAFDATTGKTLWIISTAESINSSPAEANGLIYVGDEFGDKLYAFDISTHKQRWISPVGDGNNGTTSPAIANGIVYVGSDYNTLQAVSIDTGVTLWVIFTGAQIFSSPAIANGVIYVGSWDKKLYALATSTGQTLWSYTTGGSISSSPTIANGVIYISSSDGKLYAFHLD